MIFLKTILIGICIGMANVIPGVSGSTIAVVFGIYDKFVNAITLNLKKLKENWRFVVPLLGGMILGVLIFSKMIGFLYAKFPVQTDYVFTGLVLGSIPMLAGYFVKSDKSKELSAEDKNEVKAESEELSEDSTSRRKQMLSVISIGICIFFGIAVILAFGYVESIVQSDTSMSFELPAWTVSLAVKIFIGGILGAVAMIVPGISGSLLMLIIGIYPIVIGSIPALFNPRTFVHALILLLPNGAGVLIGLLGGAKLISWLFKKFPSHTYAVIFGLIVGSAVMMFPGFSGITSVPQGLMCIVCLAFGFMMAFFSSKFSKD